MSQVQEIINFIANAADEVGQEGFAKALRRVSETLNNAPSYMHFDIVRDAWGKEKHGSQ